MKKPASPDRPTHSFATDGDTKLIGNDQSYREALGLKRPPFAPEPDPCFYFASDALDQRFSLLHALIAGRDVLVLVIGERGIGKTTFLKRYLETSEAEWKVCTIRINAAADPQQAPTDSGQSCRTHVNQGGLQRTVVMDDAHLLEPANLNILLTTLLRNEGSENGNRLVLFGEQSLIANLTACNETLGDDIAVNKIFLPVLTQPETAEYLRHRLSIAGASSARVISKRVAKKLHRISGGLPGRLNTAADHWLRQHNRRTPSLYSSNKPQSIASLRRLFNGVAAAAGEMLSVKQPGAASSSASSEPEPRDRSRAPSHGIHHEEWLLCQNPGFYTVQLLGVRSEAAIPAILQAHPFPSQDQIACFRTTHKGKTAYPLLWGVFESRAEARAAVEQLPDKLKMFFPLVRRMAAIQQSIYENDAQRRSSDADPRLVDGTR